MFSCFVKPKNLLIFIYRCLLLQVQIVYTCFRLLLILWHHDNIFLVLFNLLNGQPCRRVNPGRHFIPLVAPVFWNTGILPHTTTLNILTQDDDWSIYPASLDIPVWRRSKSIFSLLCLLPQALLFQKSLWISGLLRSLTVNFFPLVMARHECRIPWFQN